MSRLPSEDTPRSHRVRTVRHQSALGWWTMSIAAPHAAIARYVRVYCGWEEETVAPLWRVEAPGPDVPLIILFESPVLVKETGASSTPTPFGSFVAGLYDRHTVVGSAGRMAGLQANFTPLGARLLLGRPLQDFANRVVAIEDVWGAGAARLTAELAEQPTWSDRFDLLDRYIAGRIAAAAPPHPAVVWSIQTLVDSRGHVRIDALARDIGWSRRHLIARVREEFGLTPKTLARVLRLGQAVDELRRDGSGRLADVAAACGYYDQAHFTRDFREFTGMTPGAFLKSRLPDDGGVAAR